SSFPSPATRGGSVENDLRFAGFDIQQVAEYVGPVAALLRLPVERHRLSLGQRNRAFAHNVRAANNAIAYITVAICNRQLERLVAITLQVRAKADASLPRRVMPHLRGIIVINGRRPSINLSGTRIEPTVGHLPSSEPVIEVRIN